jgi:thiol-disulfide isomerase/thioredoxin
VVLWFWAPWCPTCRSQLPEVNEIAATYQGRVQVVAVGSLDSAESISRFADDIADDAVQLSDAQGTLWKHFKVTEQSSYVVLDSAGAETFRSGYGGSDDLADEVAAVAS